jgi:hypothetical protein
MRKRAILGAWRRIGSVTVVLLLLGLLGTSLHLAHPQEQGEASGEEPAQPSSPLIGVTSSSQNPLQIAILHWYDANLTTQFTTATGPMGVAFDGANIWVSNDGSNNVTKLLASTGAVLGTFTVGTNPIGVAFDGANLWVANLNSKNVTKLLASTGAVLGTFTVGTQPNALAFDGVTT